MTGGVDLRFHGAAGTVTGSCFELHWRGHHWLIDCGMFQGTRSLEQLNHEPLPFNASALNGVLLTHAHLDHSGRLAYLVKSGCRAPIWCTPATADILPDLLRDAARIEADDAKRRNRRADRAGLPPFKPLFDGHDVTRLMSQVRAIDYGQAIPIAPGATARFVDAHHIIGAASIALDLDGETLLFSGDIGPGAASAPAPSTVRTLICESTYGDRTREPIAPADRRRMLAEHVAATLPRGGNLVIPAFALERTQAVALDLVALMKQGVIPPTQVFIDAPLADRVTHAMASHRPEIAALLDNPAIHFTRQVKQSRRINRLHGVVIIAGSGMCEGGRVRHHLTHNLPKRASRVLLVGFQAAGTLGAVLRDGASHVRISGHDVPVAATVASLEGYSTHADHDGLLDFIGQRLDPQGNLFLVHGESSAIDRLKQDAGALRGDAAIIRPSLGEAWRIRPGGKPQLLQPGRADAPARTAPRDWVSRLASFRSDLDRRLRSLPDPETRDRALSAMENCLARLETEESPSARG